MTTDDQVCLSKALGSLVPKFPHSTITDATIAGYVEELCDLSLERVLIGLKTSTQESDFYPGIASIRKFAGATSSASMELAEAKWYELRKLTGYPPYSKIALDDPLTKLCFERLGGEQGFGLWDYEKDEHWRRKQFCESYAALARCQNRGISTQVNRSEAIGVLDGIISSLKDKSRPDGSVAQI